MLTDHVFHFSLFLGFELWSWRAGADPWLQAENSVLASFFALDKDFSSFLHVENQREIHPDNVARTHFEFHVSCTCKHDKKATKHYCFLAFMQVWMTACVIAFHAFAHDTKVHTCTELKMKIQPFWQLQLLAHLPKSLYNVIPLWGVYLSVVCIWDLFNLCVERAPSRRCWS